MTSLRLANLASCGDPFRAANISFKKRLPVHDVIFTQILLKFTKTVAYNRSCLCSQLYVHPGIYIYYQTLGSVFPQVCTSQFYFYSRSMLSRDYVSTFYLLCSTMSVSPSWYIPSPINGFLIWIVLKQTWCLAQTYFKDWIFKKSAAKHLKLPLKVQEGCHDFYLTLILTNRETVRF